MTYKEVFQLAQDKGYKDSLGATVKLLIWFTFKWMMPIRYVNTIDGNLEYLNLTLIQKWLMEAHMIKALPVHSDTGKFNYVIYRWNFDNNLGKWERLGHINSIDTHDLALLEGIHEALKLLP
jgi:hypothetical protein